MATHDPKNLVLPVRVRVVIDEVLYTKLPHNLKLRVR